MPPEVILAMIGPMLATEDQRSEVASDVEKVLATRKIHDIFIQFGDDESRIFEERHFTTRDLAEYIVNELATSAGISV